MNKLGNALYEIHHMDMLAAKDQWVNKIHPLVKLVLTIVFLTVTMSFPKYDLTGLLRMGIYPNRSLWWLRRRGRAIWSGWSRSVCMWIITTGKK